jgi:hypothetical protein
MSRTRQTSFLLIPLAAFLFPYSPVVSGLGNYKYCCEIQKCNNITTACRKNSDCRPACEAALSCDPPDQLATKDYSCFSTYLNNTQGNALGVICNQTYDPLHAPAPSFLIDYATCNRDCYGWKLAEANKPNSWAAPILQYILPVVIFSMTIPRRQKWEVKDWWFDFELNRVEGILRAILSLFWAGLVVIADMTVWVFVIFVGAGPMLVGGIHEAVLDYTVVQHLEDSQRVPRLEYEEHGRIIREDSNFLHLSEEDKVELMLAILSGNLDMNVGNPQKILRGVIGLPQAAPNVQIETDPSQPLLKVRASSSGRGPERRSISRTSSPRANSTGATGLGVFERDGRRIDGSGDGSSTVAGSTTVDPAGQGRDQEVAAFRERRMKLDVAEMRLTSMLQSQYSFGSVVGAPVLFYIGAFIYTLVGLSANIGDNDTAHSLAFGMWWMGIVHVAIVSGCLLASNNPSTVTAIVAEHLVQQEAGQRQSAEDCKHALTFLLMSPVYHSQFMPVPLWDRGRMKRMWVESTNAWKQQWFRDRIEIRIGWIMIPVTAFFLILVPTALAFTVSYTTPRICLSCR